MKKILIVSNNMNVGGIQKSLLELLKALDRDGSFEVSLFCCHQTGAFLDQIPEGVKMLSEHPLAKMSELPLSACKKQGASYYLLRLCFSLWSKIFTKALPAWLLCRLMGRIGEDYDVAISYAQPIRDQDFCNLTNEIVLECVRAKRKATFVHCDFGMYGGNTKRNRRLYRKFDAVAAVSHSVRDRFVSIIPELEERTFTVYNFCDSEGILALANESPVSYERPTVVTVARLSEEKGLVRCVPLFASLREKGYDLEWRIVGGGPMKDALEAEIKKYGMEDAICLAGQQINPYRYMKNARFFLLSSFHEAAPMVFDEAATLGVPILSTATLSASELVEKRGIGAVCENNGEAILHMLESALSEQFDFDLTYRPSRQLPLEQFKRLVENDREERSSDR